MYRGIYIYINICWISIPPQKVLFLGNLLPSVDARQNGIFMAHHQVQVPIAHQQGARHCLLQQARSVPKASF